MVNTPIDLLHYFPAGIPLAGDGSESLSCTITALTVPTTVNIRYEIVNDNGIPTHGSFDATATVSRLAAASASKAQLSKGVLVSATVDSATAFPAQSGQLHLQCSLKRSGSTVAQLFAGYAHSSSQPTFPYGRIGPSQDYYNYPGNMGVQLGTAPAAGAEIADVVPNAFWKLWAIEIVLVAAAVAVSRSIILVIDDAGTPVTRRLILKDTTAQTTGQTITHHWSPGTEANDANSVAYTDTVSILAKFPMSLQNGIMLFPGMNLRTITANIQGADQYGAPRYLVEEWLSR